MEINMSSMVRSLLPAVLTALLPTGQLPAQTLDSDLFRQYRSLESTVVKAHQAVNDRQTGKANELIDRCLKDIPDHFEAHFLRARLAYEARDFSKALEEVGIAERSLADLSARYHQQQALLKSQSEARQQEANDNLQVANSRGYSATSIAYFEQEKKVAGQGNGPLTGTKDPFEVPADYLFLKGNALLRLGRRPEAKAAYRRALELDSKHANAWTNLIAIELGEGLLDQAKADLASAEAGGVPVPAKLKAAVLGGK